MMLAVAFFFCPQGCEFHYSQSPTIMPVFTESAIGGFSRTRTKVETLFERLLDSIYHACHERGKTRPQNVRVYQLRTFRNHRSRPGLDKILISQHFEQAHQAQ
jgi:hypothetical protein